MKLFSIKNIDIKINMTLIPITLLMYLNEYIIEFSMLFLILTVHEIAHLIFSLINKVKVKELNIFPLGAIIKFEYPLGIDPIKEIIISLAGPIVNMILFIVSYILFINFTHINLLDLFVEINFMLFIVNILPILPLDGGRVLRALLYMHGGFKFAHKTIGVIGKISLMILFIVGLLYVKDIFEIIMLSFIIMYLAKAATAENEMAAFILTRSMIRKKIQLKSKAMMKTHFLIVLEGTKLKSILDIILPHKYNIIFIIDEEGNFLGNISEECFFDGIIKRGINEKIERLLISIKK